MTLVPPLMSTVSLWVWLRAASSMACRTRLMLPAELMFTSMLYTCSSPGMKKRSPEPILQPSTSEPVICATAFTAATCCLDRPLVGLFSLMRVRWTGMPVTVDMATVVRTIWPPPSPREPSISSISMAERMTDE